MAIAPARRGPWSGQGEREGKREREQQRAAINAKASYNKAIDIIGGKRQTLVEANDLAGEFLQ